VIGVEANQYFTVMVKHDGKPLAGVLVEIPGEGKEQFSGVTATDGKVRLNLSPGHYWLKPSSWGSAQRMNVFTSISNLRKGQDGYLPTTEVIYLAQRDELLAI
jgi:hypothetical protein